MATKRKMTAAIYARVSTADQNCSMQLTELTAFAERMGWQTVEYVDLGESGVKRSRPALDRMMADSALRKFDVVLTWKLDRYGRSARDLTDNIQKLDSRGIRFMCPNQGIDTDKKSPISRLMLNMFAAFAEFERDLIVERVNAGLAQYKLDHAKGKAKSHSGKNLAIGRPGKVYRRDMVEELRAEGMSWRKIAAKLDVPFSTIRPRKGR